MMWQSIPNLVLNLKILHAILIQIISVINRFHYSDAFAYKHDSVCVQRHKGQFEHTGVCMSVRYRESVCFLALDVGDQVIQKEKEEKKKEKVTDIKLTGT